MSYNSEDGAETSLVETNFAAASRMFTAASEKLRELLSSAEALRNEMRTRYASAVKEDRRLT
jgi:hypothetical protein